MNAVAPTLPSTVNLSLGVVVPIPMNPFSAMNSWSLLNANAFVEVIPLPVKLVLVAIPKLPSTTRAPANLDVLLVPLTIIFPPNVAVVEPTCNDETETPPVTPRELFTTTFPSESIDRDGVEVGASNKLILFPIS